MDVVVAVLAGVLTGVVSSFAVWFYVTRMLAPKLEWVDHIEERTADGYTGYRARLNNKGRRSVYDVDVSAAIVIDRLVPGERKTYLSFATRNLPELKSTTDSMPGRVINVGPLFLDPAVLRRRQPFIPADLIERIERWEHVPLQELLALGEGGVVELSAYSRDIFSGSRSVHTASIEPDRVLVVPWP